MDTQVIVLPQLRAVFHVKQAQCGEQNQSNLVVAGGRAPASAWLQQVAKEKTIYCADRGLCYCDEANLLPQAIYGDCDSADPALYDKYAARGSKIQLYPPAKDDTDLQLVLQQLPQANLIATGVWGGRYDHLYSNIYSLLNWKIQHGRQVVLADEIECLLLLQAGESVSVSFNTPQNVQALSILPLSGQCRASFQGVHWQLKEAVLKQLHPYSISNVLEDGSDSCTSTCQEGMLGLYIIFSPIKNEGIS